MVSTEHRRLLVGERAFPWPRQVAELARGPDGSSARGSCGCLQAVAEHTQQAADRVDTDAAAEFLQARRANTRPLRAKQSQLHIKTVAQKHWTKTQS